MYSSGDRGCVPQQAGIVQRLDLCASVPLSLPARGAGSPSQRLGGLPVPAGRVSCPIRPHAAAPPGEGRRWGSGPPP